jgi:predicted component of type VI protein secretion system
MAAHKFSAATFHKMIRQLAATEAVEYACDDVLRVLDQFAEAFLRGENVAQLMPLVQRHLDMCPDCREEFEALLRILRAGAAPA